MAAEMRWTDALQDLLMQHTPFQPSDTDDFKELTRQFSALERLFLKYPKLRWYYAGCMGITCEGVEESVDPCDTVNAASMQIQLMEDAFFSLRLYHYTNAPDNRGWMNLFRSWGRYEPFQQHFKTLSPHFSARFTAFYAAYIENWQAIDDEPVPHAWDVGGDVPETELPPEEELLPEELERRNMPIELSPYQGVTAQSVSKTKGRSTRSHVLKGLFMDRGRREAGTSEGMPAGRHQDVQSPIEGEHSEAPTEPPGEPA